MLVPHVDAVFSSSFVSHVDPLVLNMPIDVVSITIANAVYRPIVLIPPHPLSTFLRRRCRSCRRNSSSPWSS